MFRSKWSLLAVVIAAVSQNVVRAESAMGEHFTYQGKLSFGGSVINDTCDFEFGLWDNLSGPNQVGVIYTATSVAVVDGLFTTNVAFSVGSFNGNARYLELAVRCPAGAGLYTPLTPRQELTAAPHALALPGMRTEWTLSSPPDSPNIIGGYFGNTITGNITGATISGGGAGGGGAAINEAQSIFSTIGGGEGNTANGSASTIGGGAKNSTGGNNATVAGGRDNNALGSSSTVPGGEFNEAVGNYSYAAGYRAKANHEGSYVWADFTGADFASTGPNQYLIRADGGVGIGLTNPATQLHVDGNAATGLTTFTYGGGASVIGESAVRIGTAYNARHGLSIRTSNNLIGDPKHASLWIENVGAGGLTLYAGDTQNDTTPFVIDHTGNVGVKTSTPSSPLTVAGVIESTSGGIKFPDGSVQTSASSSNAVSMGKVYLTGNGTIQTAYNGDCVLIWDRTNSEIEMTNASGDWCDYWWQTQKGSTTSGSSGAKANGTSNVVLISGTNGNDYGFEIHFGRADGASGWTSVWLQYANSVLVGHYIKY